MAITRIQGGSNLTTGSGSTTFAITLGAAVGSGNAICGVVGWVGGALVTGIADDKGNTYARETGVVDATGNYTTVAFSRTNITNAPVTITVTFNGTSPTNKTLIVDEFAGTSTASSDERDGAAHGGQFESAPGTATDAIDSGGFTTTNNGDLLYGACVTNATTALASNGTGFSTGTQDNSGATIARQSEYRTQATAGAGTAATFTQAVAARRMTMLIAIKASPIADLSATALTVSSPALGAPDLVRVLAAAATNYAAPSPILVTVPGFVTYASGATPVDLEVGSPVLGAPALGQKHVLVASTLTTASPVLGAPALVPTSILIAAALTTASPALGNPNAVCTVPTGLTVGSPVIGAPALAVSGLDLTALNLVVASPALGAPNLVNTVPLGLTVSAPVLGAPLLICAVAIGKTVGSPVLGSPNLVNTVPVGLTVSSPVLGAPALVITGVTLAAVNLTVGSPVLPAPYHQYMLRLSDRVIDFGLTILDQEATDIYLCSERPADYTEATSTFALGFKSYAAGDVFGAPGAGSPNGRVVTSGAIGLGEITGNGIALYWAAVDTVNARLLTTGPITPSEVGFGQAFALSSLSVHMFG